MTGAAAAGARAPNARLDSAQRALSDSSAFTSVSVLR